MRVLPVQFTRRSAAERDREVSRTCGGGRMHLFVLQTAKNCESDAKINKKFTGSESCGRDLMVCKSFNV